MALIIDSKKVELQNSRLLARVNDTAMLPVEVWASTQHRWHPFSASIFVPLDAEGESVGKYTYHMSKETYTNTVTDSERRF